MASIEESVTAMIPAMAAEIAAKIKEQTFRNIEYTTGKAIAEAVTGDGPGTIYTAAGTYPGGLTAAFLSKELQPIIDTAKANLKTCLDAEVMKTVSETIANAVGLR